MRIYETLKFVLFLMLSMCECVCMCVYVFVCTHFFSSVCVYVCVRLFLPPSVTLQWPGNGRYSQGKKEVLVPYHVESPSPFSPRFNQLSVVTSFCFASPLLHIQFFFLYPSLHVVPFLPFLFPCYFPSQSQLNLFLPTLFLS